MALAFKKYERDEQVSLGTVAEVTGIGGKFALIPANFNNPEKRVVVILKKLDGTSAQVTCSPKVSQGLRSKEITLSMLQGFEIFENITVTGEIVNTITIPSGAAMLEFDVSETSTAYEVAKFDPSDLVAF